MSISNRIIAGFAAVTLILVVLGIYALGQVGSVRTTVDMIVERDIASMQQLTRADQALGRMVEYRTATLRNFMINRTIGENDPIDKWGEAASTVQAELASLREKVDRYRSEAVTAERAQQWTTMIDQLRAAEASVVEARRDVEAQFAALRAGDQAAALRLEPIVLQHRQRMLERVGAVRATLDEAVVRGRTAAANVYEESRLSILLGLAVAIAVSIGVAVTIRRSISVPLADFMDFVGRVGQGDLTSTTRATGSDELGQLGVTLNAMVEGLREIARQSRQTTENLNAAATEIRASTQEQAASVEEQLAAVQETAATVDEITHSGTQISRRAQEVIAAAQATAQTSESGVAAVEDTVRAMDAIREQAEAVASNIVALSEKTQAIGDIIATVNDVSERSHLLALNAAIEAAAAGENGRSFAVVASEMKALADQAKDATRNVRAILGDVQRGITASVMLTEEAVKRVAAGKQRTDASQSAIEELGHRIQESVQTFQQIVASTNQQQIGIEQVTIALQNIRQASQQTAASTRQLDQAAADLTQLSSSLVVLTERYRI